MANRWSVEEEKLLASVWLEVCQSRETSNHRSFWNDFTQRFNDQTDDQNRSKNAITAHWSRITHECHRFHVIYKELQRTSDDPNRLSLANQIYHARHGRGLNYQHAWFVLRNAPTWERGFE